ncbi:MAG TPA: Nramp family divalent metal transporter [Rhizomicrobium sp.]|jgi:manganese transport protein|nr:Nramp family divalent metal transporter [Rhizomicrobium sp.]
MSPPPPADAIASSPRFAAGKISTDRKTPVWNGANAARMARKFASFAGPGYLIAVGYMDPGNWATDIAGGSKFGYALLPAILLANFAAMFLQWLALRLGIATGRDLAQACRDRYSPTVARLMWIICEIAIVACDLAEVIGTAIALQLLFGLPLVFGVAVTSLDTLLLLGLQKIGFRSIEAFVIVLTIVIGACFSYEMLCCAPSASGIVASLIPGGSTFANPQALYLALAIFGATVMPHNLYLHSSIAQTRKIAPTVGARREAIRYSTVDCITALTFALLINAAILILAAAAFHASGHTAVAEIQDAYKLLSPLMGAGAASIVFAVALLAAGQNSTLTGTMAGQIVMEGFLGLKMNPVLRRLVTRGLAIIPAAIVAVAAGERGTSQLLIFSQVVLSLQLGFAVIPLVIFTSDKKLMGPFVNKPWVSRAGYVLGAGIVAINSWLVVETIIA